MNRFHVGIFRFGSFVLAVYFLFAFVCVGPATAQTKRSPVAPTREEAEVIVREAYNKFRSDTSGNNANYIPYLAQVDSTLFGVVGFLKLASLNPDMSRTSPGPPPDLSSGLAGRFRAVPANESRTEPR